MAKWLSACALTGQILKASELSGLEFRSRYDPEKALPEYPAALLRNQWPVCSGITGRFHRNTQFDEARETVLISLRVKPAGTHIRSSPVNGQVGHSISSRKLWKILDPKAGGQRRWQTVNASLNVVKRSHCTQSGKIGVNFSYKKWQIPQVLSQRRKTVSCLYSFLPLRGL